MSHDWYRKSAQDVLHELHSSDAGLTSETSVARLAEDGPNALPEAKGDSLAMIFLRQFESPLIYILLIACAVMYFLGEVTDAAIILAVLAFNAVAGAIQEGRAQNTLRAIKHFVETTATVVRDGEERMIRDRDVVRGDIIVLHEGEKIPADARVLEAHGLKADESSLTGESEPVGKSEETVERDGLMPAEQRNMLFKGTTVVAGGGRAVVVAVGQNTVIGGIASKLTDIDAEIPLKRNIRYLSRAIIAAVGVIAILFSLLAFARDVPPAEIFTTVVSIIVSVVPEGLPIVMTLVLATGVWRMSKRNALVKKLQAVEALGQASVIAVDKTGTITKNELVIREVWTDGKVFTIGGVGYEPKGTVELDGHAVDIPNHPELLFAAKMATFCASARVTFSEEEERWRIAGDPTEAALRVFGEKAAFRKDDLLRESPFVAEIPFDYKLKFHATVHRVSDKDFLVVLGAPEAVLSRCSSIRVGETVRELTDRDREELQEALVRMSGKGLRTVAGAYTDDAALPLRTQEMRGLVFAGLYGMQDVLRQEVGEAMQRARDAGIRVVMITGDHRITARAIAEEAGIWRKGDDVLTGEDIDRYSELQLKEKLPHVTVFARVTPEDKLRIVNAYKAAGETIAMTGDGVNDAPPLVAADLGVAMGKIGTEVAKEAADIVLLDDNFGSIISAVEEGRSIYRTIRKVILYLFSTNAGEVLTIAGALLLGLPLPILASQIIWLNFVTDGFLTVALAMDPKEEGLLKERFRKPNKFLIDRSMFARILLMAGCMTVGTLLLFGFVYADDYAKAVTVSLSVLAVYQWFNVWNCRSASASIFSRASFSNYYLLGAMIIVVALQLLAVYTPFLQSVLHTTALSLQDWLLILPVAFSIVLVEEARKWAVRRRTANAS